MAGWDWIVLVAYLTGLVGMSACFWRRQSDARDYYLAGNRTGPLPIALSTMATQCSTNSLLGAPAFVGFAAGGGLLWLQYELAVPLAMIVLIAVFFPLFRRLRLISVYGYLEARFDRRTRVILSILFQVLRAFATGVTVYGVSLVLMLVLGVEFWVAVLLLGAVTVGYDLLGGMRAVIWSDVIQLVVLTGAIVISAIMAIVLSGGWETVWAFTDPDRMRGLDWRRHGLGDGHDYALWPMLIGGVFLYVAYYGCDQTQAQRELSTRSVNDTSRALFFDGILRFPLVAAYCFLGICLAAYAASHPDFLRSEYLLVDGAVNYNRAVPAFVVEHFPVGLVGLVIAGLFAAAMSSLDSTINALSALSMEDVVKQLRRRPMSARAELIASKGLTLFWGAVCLAFAFQVDAVAETVIEAVNKISSLLNGPLLAVFAMGVLTRRVNGAGAVSGLLTGFGGNLLVMWLLPGVSWLWWNVTGFLIAWFVGWTVSLLTAPPPREKIALTLWETEPIVERRERLRRWRLPMAVLAAYAIGLICLLGVLNLLAG